MFESQVMYFVKKRPQEYKPADRGGNFTQRVITFLKNLLHHRERIIINPSIQIREIAGNQRRPTYYFFYLV